MFSGKLKSEQDNQTRIIPLFGWYLAVAFSDPRGAENLNIAIKKGNENTSTWLKGSDALMRWFFRRIGLEV